MTLSGFVFDPSAVVALYVGAVLAGLTAGGVAALLRGLGRGAG